MQPPWPDRGHAVPADLAACRLLLREGSRTFYAASRLLPYQVRQPAIALYAFCRLADDAVDLGGGSSGLARMRLRLARAYDGRPMQAPVDRAFADVVARFALPRELPEALFEGFAWDAEGRRYDTLSNLHAYAARVAGTVGVMMAMLMGVREPQVLARACDLGVAMQLTNIARDVGEDARAGRLYLPRQWLREAGIEPQPWLVRPVFDERLARVIERLLDEADRLYRRADGGIARLPGACRPAIHAARLLYAGIGDELRRIGLDSVRHRAVVPLPRKLALLTAAVAAARRPPVAGRPLPPLDEVRFLIEAVDAAPPRPVRQDLVPDGLPWWNVSGRAAWVIQLFTKLERLERSGTGP